MAVRTFLLGLRTESSDATRVGNFRRRHLGIDTITNIVASYVLAPVNH